ncbi:DJ-1/PfpI family protein [Acinetobacter tianfuensis]|uniref:DJ-1/PfpI family protein n=1 Tax=Acinetobacter tianfuensis TaxID=2419603 RepID=A0A3A8EP91_9GAMM|nr:DJ-1/PfpI family protein [Acinetobacter tianfuensis]RKG31784.1 DJ-1/PfpI family protein [Acinetobacter tianfuensis]
MNLGILLFDEVEVLDFAGPFEVFSICSGSEQQKLFNVFTVSEQPEVTARNGLQVKSHYTLDTAPHIDILVIPGGLGAETVEMYNPRLRQWLLQRHAQAQLTFSICTGAFILAEAGLLNGLKATTHWMDIARLTQEYPQIEVLSDVKYVDEGKIITAAGISSGINASLYIVAKLHGLEIAKQTAKRMEYDAAFVDAE